MIDARAMRAGIITAWQAALIHLDGLYGDSDEPEASPQRTIRGVCEAIGLNPKRYQRALDSITRWIPGTRKPPHHHGDHLERIKKRVLGEARQFAYYVTPYGKMTAAELRGRLNGLSGRFILIDGSAVTVTLREAGARYGVRPDHPAVLRALRFREAIDLRTISTEARRSETMPLTELCGATWPQDFSGRDEELAELGRFVSGNWKLMMITGLSGVGKSTLVLEFLRQISSSWNIFYCEVEGLVPYRMYLDRLRRFWQRLGYFQKGGEPLISLVPTALETRTFMILDFRRFPPAFLRVLETLLRQMPSVPNVKACILLRKPLSLAVLSDLKSDAVETLPLRPMDSEEVDEMLGAYGEGGASEILSATGGFPVWVAWARGMLQRGMRLKEVVNVISLESHETLHAFLSRTEQRLLGFLALADVGMSDDLLGALGIPPGLAERLRKQGLVDAVHGGGRFRVHPSIQLWIVSHFTARERQRLGRALVTELLKHATHRLGAGDRTEALHSCLEAQRVARKLGLVSISLLETLFDLLAPVDAEEALKLSAEVIREGDTLTRARMLRKVGWLRWDRERRFGAPLNHFHRSLALLRRLRRPSPQIVEEIVRSGAGVAFMLHRKSKTVQAKGRAKRRLTAVEKLVRDEPVSEECKAWFEFIRASFWFHEGDYGRAEKGFLEAASLGAEPRRVGAANLSLAHAYQGMGDLERASEACAKAILASRAALDLDLAGRAHTMAGFLCLSLFQMEQAEFHLRLGLRLAETMEDALIRTSALQGLAIRASLSGESLVAKQLSVEALELAKEAEDPYGAEITMRNLGGVYLRCGDFERAEHLLRDSVEMLRRPEEDRLELLKSILLLTEIVIARGDTAEAERCLQEMSHFSKLEEDQGLLGRWLLLRGLVDAYTRRPQAEDRLRESLQHLETVRDRHPEYFALAVLALAWFCKKARRVEEAGRLREEGLRVAQAAGCDEVAISRVLRNETDGTPRA